MRSCVLMQEATTFNIFCDGLSFQHLATVFIIIIIIIIIIIMVMKG
jgi:hypothetical protein